MDRLDGLGLESLMRYFHSLSVFGYMDYGNVYKLLSLLALTDMLEGRLSEFITDDDYRHITNALYSLFGTTCLIPYPKFKCSSTFNPPINNTPRISEDEILRYDENGIFRLADI